jgi:ADP-heptose:LPS heptosyltransferase
VPPSLLELAPHIIGVTDLVTWSSPETPEPSWDIQVEINELPYIFRTQLHDLPIATNYLKLPGSILSASRPKPKKLSSLRVGVVWSSGEWNPSRNVPFSLFRSLLEEPQCEFWNLQGGAARADCTHTSVHRSEQCVNSLLNLAALIAQLDLIITPDTLAAHLAGATGTPAFLLPQHAADWRWLHDRSDSPWYPTLRLFRQPRPDDWFSVVHAVRTALANYPVQALIA